MLIDPRQPVATQSRNFRAHNWLKTDVAGAADQGCAQAYLEVLDGGLTLAQMGKGLGESGSRHDFKKDVGHPRLRHARLDGAAQRTKALGFIKLVGEIGRAHVCTPVTNAHLVCRLLLEKKNNKQENSKTTDHQ